MAVIGEVLKETMYSPVQKVKGFWASLGPGLVTGSSDDDPSGIATYSQAGAAFGLATLWTALFTFPLMAAIQEMCARIGLVTSKGLTGVIKEHYSRSILYLLLLFSFPAIALNIGADIAGMGAVSNLIVPSIPAFVFSVLFSIIIIASIIYFPYSKIASILKWLCLVLLVYILVPFVVGINWKQALISAVTPTITFSKEYFSILVAILGTTISPYLFFWQTTMAVEDRAHKKQIFVDKQEISDMKFDVNSGMFFSNLVQFFIILTAGVVLFNAGINNIDTVEQAALALKPIAGNLSYLLFAVGIIGTGFLAIPVLAGAISYSFAEVFGWDEGMDKKLHEAKGFYLIMGISIAIGLLINILGLSPVKMLIYSAIGYGITAPLLIAMILHVCNNKSVMGEYVNSKSSNILGVCTLLLMAASAIAFFVL